MRYAVYNHLKNGQKRHCDVYERSGGGQNHKLPKYITSKCEEENENHH